MIGDYEYMNIDAIALVDGPTDYLSLSDPMKRYWKYLLKHDNILCDGYVCVRVEFYERGAKYNTLKYDLFGAESKIIAAFLSRLYLDMYGEKCLKIVTEGDRKCQMDSNIIPKSFDVRCKDIMSIMGNIVMLDFGSECSHNMYVTRINIDKAMRYKCRNIVALKIRGMKDMDLEKELRTKGVGFAEHYMKDLVSLSIYQSCLVGQGNPNVQIVSGENRGNELLCRIEDIMNNNNIRYRRGGYAY